MNMSGCKGFTLIEILVSLVIGMIIFGTIAMTTLAFARQRSLDTAVEVAVSYLRTAVTRSMQSEGNTTHGVSFAADKMTLFRGASYASRQTDYDTVWSQPSYITVTGLSEIVFSKHAALPSVSGDIMISNGLRSIDVTVHPTGAISQP